MSSIKSEIVPPIERENISTDSHTFNYFRSNFQAKAAQSQTRHQTTRFHQKNSTVSRGMTRAKQADLRDYKSKICLYSNSFHSFFAIFKGNQNIRTMTSLSITATCNIFLYFYAIIVNRWPGLFINQEKKVLIAAFDFNPIFAVNN